jgi:hypothetical protein
MLLLMETKDRRKGKDNRGALEKGFSPRQQAFESTLTRQDKKFAPHDKAEGFPPFSSTEMQEYRVMRVKVRELARLGDYLDSEDTAKAIGVKPNVLSQFMNGSRPTDCIALKNFSHIRAALTKLERIEKAGQ